MVAGWGCVTKVTTMKMMMFSRDATDFISWIPGGAGGAVVIVVIREGDDFSVSCWAQAAALSSKTTR